MSMQYVNLGRSGLRVSRLALGAMNFGMTTDESVSHRILDKAVEGGINVVDTADVYGGPQSADMAQGYGTSEEIIGRWLARSGRRDDIVLATKVYQPMGLGRTTAGCRHFTSGVPARRACVGSAQTTSICTRWMHHVDRATPWEEIWQAMEQLVGEGKISYVGSSNFAGWDIAVAQAVADRRGFFGLVSEQSLYNLTTRAIELEVIPALAYHGIGLIPWSPLAGGLLAGVVDGEGGERRDHDQIRDRAAALQPQLAGYQALCGELGEEPATVAMAWAAGPAGGHRPDHRPAHRGAAGCRPTRPGDQAGRGDPAAAR
jgi:aryl-alcohol dehydrogenase-like predicted oxidoreductase